MMSFQLSISPARRTAARFVLSVRRALQKAYAEQKRAAGITQSELARRIGVHRSVINRQLQGRADMSLGRVAEFAYALGLEPRFELVPPRAKPFSNEIVTESKTAALDIDASPQLVKMSSSRAA